MSHWIEKLNPEQQQAVLHDYGPLLILAGAGSGKTTVLVSRTGRLIEERIADAKKICVLTFTNKAARELKHRVSHKLGALADGVWAGTFHSFGLQVLRQFHKEAGLPQRFGILDSGDAQGLAKEILKDYTLADKSDFDAGKLLSIMSAWREKGQTEAVNDDPYEVTVQWLMPKYLKRIHQMGVVDFDGLLLKPLSLFEKHPEIELRVQSAFTQVMVDEFQDTNRTQMALVGRLAERHKNLAVVGDDDQSIYGWRGACIENILQFPRHYDDCRVIRLERNYRSTPAILNLANAVISKNDKRHGKVLRPYANEEPGDLPELFVYDNEDVEAEKIADEIEEHAKQGYAYKDIAVLFRSNGQGALFEAEFKKRQIPHQVTGGSGFFERKEIKDVIAYLRCSLRPNEISLRRILNTPSRGLGEAAVDHLTEFAEKHRISFFEALKRSHEAGLTPQACEGAEALLKTFVELKTATLDTGLHPAASVRLLQFFHNLGYKQHIEKHAKDSVQASQRWRLIEIFGNVLDRFFSVGGLNEKTLREFIDCMELHDTGEDEEKNSNAVQLLTLHACKGLEFPLVLLAGIEEEILPHRTLGTDVSEERRLFYVGITRARKKLILSRVRQRKRFGKLVPCAPSRFLAELPASLFKEYELGWRPINSSERQAMLAELYKKLDSLDRSPDK